MAAGCVVLASDHEPHREFIAHGQTGLLVDAADAGAVARRALAVLDDPAGHRPMGDAAAALIRRRYSQDACLPLLAEQFSGLALAGRRR
jgi:glycosyltransferase involved in cell wall biosynthesis